MKRREMLLSAGAALCGLSAFPLGWVPAAENRKQRILYFTRCAGFVHPVVDRKGKSGLSFSEQELTKMCGEKGVEVVCTKDGNVFDREKKPGQTLDLDQFDAVAFYTSGYLTQGGDDPTTSPMTEAGKARLLDAIAKGKGFLAFHAANDSFHSQAGKISDFIAMLGGEFVVHGRPQEALMKVVSPKFPGVEKFGGGFKMTEEWYALNNFAKDLHVILVQETAGMVDSCYQRPPYPATWARKQANGRVFYTSMGHYENVWTSPVFRQVVLGGLAWALKNVDADVPPNIDQVTPKANQMTR
jgi:uncharacterized protein